MVFIAFPWPTNLSPQSLAVMEACTTLRVLLQFQLQQKWGSTGLPYASL